MNANGLRCELYGKLIGALIIPACLKERQRSRLTTLECLEAQCDPVLNIELPVAEGVAKCAA